MIHIRIDSNGFAGFQLHLCSCRNREFPSVTVNGNIRIRELFVLCGIVYTNQYISAASVDDVFHLVPVEMHGRHLSFLYVQKLFRIGFGIFGILQVAVTDGNQ